MKAPLEHTHRNERAQTDCTIRAFVFKSVMTKSFHLCFETPL